MKRIISFTLAAILVTAIFSLAACSKSGSKDSSSDADTLSGTYNLIEITADGVTMDPASLEMTSVLTIDGDHATLTRDDVTTNLTVDRKKKTVYADDGSDPVSYRTEGNKLIMEDSNLSLTFEKQ